MLSVPSSSTQTGVLRASTLADLSALGAPAWGVAAWITGAVRASIRMHRASVAIFFMSESPCFMTAGDGGQSHPSI